MITLGIIFGALAAAGVVGAVMVLAVLHDVIK